jgi:hypothetical protein
MSLPQSSFEQRCIFNPFFGVGDGLVKVQTTEMTIGLSTAPNLRDLGFGVERT